MAELAPQSVAKLVVFRAFLSSDHVTPATAKTIAITLSKNGATTFSNPNAGATNATEMASGFYKFTLDTTDTGTAGPLAWRGAGTGVDDIGDAITIANAHNAGFDGVPNAAAEAAGGLYTRGTGAGQIAQDANGNVRVNVDTIKGNAVVNGGTITFPTTATLASTTNITAGTITTATNLTNAPTAGDFTAAMKTSLNAATPASITGAVGSVTGAVGSVTARVTANTDQLAGSATAATNLSNTSQVNYTGTVTGATTTTTLIDSGLTQADTDFWKGRILIFLTGALKFQATDITAFTPATDQLTFTALTAAPSGGDTYVVL